MSKYYMNTVDKKGKRLGTKWFTFYYTVRMILGALVAVGSLILACELIAMGAENEDALMLSCILYVINLAISVSLFYLFLRYRRQPDTHYGISALYFVTKICLVIELIGNIVSGLMSTPPQMISTWIVAGIFFVLNWVYFSKRAELNEKSDED